MSSAAKAYAKALLAADRARLQLETAQVKALAAEEKRYGMLLAKASHARTKAAEKEEKARLKEERKARKEAERKAKKEGKEREKEAQRRRVEESRKALWGLQYSQVSEPSTTARAWPFPSPVLTSKPKSAGKLGAYAYDSVTTSRVFPGLSRTSALAILELEDEAARARGGRR